MPKKTANKRDRQLAATVFDGGASGVLEKLLTEVAKNETVHAFDDLAAARDEKPTRPVLVLALSPKLSLALALQQADDPEQALVQWCEATSGFLSQQRRARKHVTVVDARQFANADDVAWDALTARLGVDLSSAQGAIDAMPEPAAILRLAATAFLDSNDEARELADEFQAIMLGAAEEQLDGATVVEALQNMRDAEQFQELARDNISLQSKALDDQTERLNHLEAVNADLKQQLDVLCEKDDLLRENAALLSGHVVEASQTPQTGINAAVNEGATIPVAVSERLALMDENVGLQIELAQDYAARISEVEAERDDLRRAVSDRHLLKASNEALTRRLANAVQTAQRREEILGAVLLSDSTDETQHLKDELERVYASKSWRVTSPLRSISGRRGA